MQKTLLNVKIDRKLKQEAQKMAQELGLPLGTVVKAYLREFVRERRVVFSSPPVPNVRTQKLLQHIREDMKRGRNVDGPFRYQDALRYLGRA